MGFRVGEPYALELQNDRTDTILRTITKNLTENTQMVSWKYKSTNWVHGRKAMHTRRHMIQTGPSPFGVHRKVPRPNLSSLTNDKFLLLCLSL